MLFSRFTSLLPNQAPGKLGKLVVSNLEIVLNKNIGFKTLETISEILQGEQTSIQGLPEDIISDEMVYFKFAPVDSFDIERRLPATFFV